MRTLLPFDDLANVSDTALKRLGFKYYRNQSKKVLEFEVFEPVQFLVRIEDLHDDGFRPQAFFGLIGGGGGGNSLAVIPGSEDPSERVHVATFVNVLLESLPKKPWEGLGFIESRTSKAYWRGLGLDGGSGLSSELRPSGSL